MCCESQVESLHIWGSGLVGLQVATRLLGGIPSKPYNPQLKLLGIAARLFREQPQRTAWLTQHDDSCIYYCLLAWASPPIA
jgi:hypothetical protein